jgi:hypothetical protein
MTTHLHYTQNMQENNSIYLLTLTGISYQYEWLRTGSGRALLIGSCAFGLNLLTRLTTGLDLLAGGVFILLVLVFERAKPDEFWRRFRSYLVGTLPVYLFFCLLDRLYQFYRFGSFFNTYIGMVAQEARQRDPSLPANYPFTTPMHTGVLGALFTPEKSIFLFDPLLLLTVLMVAVTWRRFSAALKAYTITMGLLLLSYLCFYGRYFAWAGDSAWGDRYVSTTLELATLLTVPLLLAYRMQVGRVVWLIGVALMAASLAIQAASVAFWLPLEIYQMATLGHPTFVVGLRIENVIAFSLGKMDAWGLTNSVMNVDAWDYVHMTSWNFLPFQLARAGTAPEWVVRVALTVWEMSLAALALVLWRLRKIVAELPEGGGDAGIGSKDR